MWRVYVIEKFESTVSISEQHVDFDESGVKLRLTILDTPGFCESLNGEDR